jgi:hypothetical protein
MTYWTFSQSLEEVARLGRGTLMFFADLKSAYKILRITPQEWYLQMFRIAELFYFDKTGVFGDVAAGDNWDKVMRVDLRIAQVRLNLKYLHCYVDNYSNFTPPLPREKPDSVRAEREFGAFLSHHRELGSPLHKIIEPTTRVESYLGWGIDTQLMQVFMKVERRERLIEILEAFGEETITRKLVNN